MLTVDHDSFFQPNAPVTIVSDQKSNYWFGFFRDVLGEEYLSIVSNWSLDMETVNPL